MLKFLKKLFKKEEEKLELDFLELNTWLDLNYYQKINSAIGKMSAIAQSIRDATRDLEKRDVSEEKVEERLKTVVAGNKEAFLKAVHALATKFVRADLGKKSLSAFTEECLKELSQFNAKTTKNFYVMKNLIGKELDATTSKLRELHSATLDLKALADKEEAAETVRKELAEVQSHIEEKPERLKKLREWEGKRDAFLEKEKQVKEGIEQLRTGRVFKEYEQLSIRKGNFQQEENTLKNEVENLFAPLKKALKKSVHAKDKLASGYLENAYLALQDDSELKIHPMMGDIVVALESGKIEAKQKDKLASQIKALTKERLQKERAKMAALQKEKASVKKAMENNTFTEEEEKLVKDLQATVKALAEANDAIENLLSFEMGRDIKTLKKAATQLAGREVVLKNAPLD
ncbi:hypothetical protein HY501_01510 [Candidatus Woesearchaeota archaeon]|nr:hypothetical protein [Candidatus Woesearchaeota archaeon]